MVIKAATELNEFIQIHQLNYKTFVEEIPQHEQNPEEILVDKFHNSNKYIVAKKGDKVIGMVSYNHERPFSLDGKIPDLDRYLPEHNQLVEIRLLSISQEERKTRVAYRLFQFLSVKLMGLNTDAAVISGTTRQLKLYSQIGFIPFGPIIGTGEALYQPMYITLNDLRHDFRIN